MMRRLGFAAVMFAATASAMPTARDMPPGPCAVSGQKTISFGQKRMHVPVPLYDKAKPLGAQCTEKRSVVVTRESIFVLPGWEIFGNRYEVDADISLRQDIPLARRKGGITAWALGGDDLYFMTKDAMFWKTGLYERGLIGYDIPEFNGGSGFSVSYSDGITLVSQENTNGRCLIAIDASSTIAKSKSFGFASCSGAGFEGALFAADGKRYSITVQNGVGGTYLTRAE